MIYVYIAQWRRGAVPCAIGRETGGRKHVIPETLSIYHYIYILCVYTICIYIYIYTHIHMHTYHTRTLVYIIQVNTEVVTTDVSEKASPADVPEHLVNNVP